MFALLLAISVATDFEGGSLGKVQQVSPSHLRCGVKGEADQDGRNRQASWYYFRVDNLPRAAVTVDLVDIMGEYNYRPANAVTRHTRPVYSYDQRTWQHFRDSEVEWDEKEPRLRLRFTPRETRMWIAHVAPYTNGNLARLLEEFRASPLLKQESVGRTVASRDIPLLTIGHGPAVVWLICRQHSWEAGTSWVCEGALRFLLSSEARAAAVRERVTFRILPLADPDGVARGGVRFNANGYDLNRNWDTVDPSKMPEIAAQRKAILDWVDAGRRLDLLLSLHNTESGEYLETAPAGRARAERLFRRLSETTTFNPTTPLRQAGETTTPGKPGRMTVVQGLYRDRKLPAMLMEQMIEYNSKLGRLPTVADRLRFGEELITAIGAIMDQP
jgi:hypothetical protein